LTFDGAPAEVRLIARDLGLTITVFQPFRDFEAMPQPQRARSLDPAERKFDVMQALGTELMLVCVIAACCGSDNRRNRLVSA
jgi:4-hydroxyphenylpyruvate dioxygenase